VGSNFGEEGRRLSYGSYLKIPELLSLQECLTEAHDELLFIAVHQAYELWFKVLLQELEAVRDRMQLDDTFWSRHALRRVSVIWRLLIEQVEVLETIDVERRLELVLGWAKDTLAEVQVKEKTSWPSAPSWRRRRASSRSSSGRSSSSPA